MNQSIPPFGVVFLYMSHEPNLQFASLVTKDEMARMPLKRYFGIEKAYDDGYGDDLDFILGWAVDKGVPTEDDLMVELRKIETRLGSAQLGETRLSRIKNYLKLDGKITSHMKELKAMEVKNNEQLPE